MTSIATSNRLLRILVLLCIWSVLLVCVSMARSEDKAVTVEDFKRLLAENPVLFEDYKTTNVWSGKRRPPILNTRFKRLFKTVLREAAKGGPNFEASMW